LPENQQHSHQDEENYYWGKPPEPSLPHEMKKFLGQRKHVHETKKAKNSLKNHFPHL